MTCLPFRLMPYIFTLTLATKLRLSANVGEQRFASKASPLPSRKSATAFHQRLFSTVNSCICIVSVRHCSLPFIPSSCVLEKCAIRSIDVAHSSSTNQTSADFPFILLFANTFVCSESFLGGLMSCANVLVLLSF